MAFLSASACSGVSFLGPVTKNGTRVRERERQTDNAHILIHSFIHFGHFYSAPSSPSSLSGAPDYSTDTVSEFHAEAHRQLQVKDLPKVAARAGVEPTKVFVSTNAPPRHRID